MYGRVLSLDTSSKSTGYAFYEDQEFVTSGVIQVLSVQHVEKRMMIMVQKIYDLIEQFEPSTIVIENTVVLRNPKVQRCLTMLLGAVFGKCATTGIDYVSLNPTEWRKLVDTEKKPRKREALKEWSKDKVREMFGINVGDDESDAILIGYGYVMSDINNGN